MSTSERSGAYMRGVDCFRDNPTMLASFMATLDSTDYQEFLDGYMHASIDGFAAEIAMSLRQLSPEIVAKVMEAIEMLIKGAGK